MRSKTKMIKKAGAKIIQALANSPRAEDISKATSKRAMFSLKTKKQVAGHAIRHKLKPSVIASVYPNISTAMMSAWMKDHRADKYKLGNAVAVSRS